MKKPSPVNQGARDRGAEIRMVKYVRGSQYDKWHWCKNCTQYPMYIYQETPIKPPSDFCEQCTAKEKTANCQCEELKNTTEMQSKSDFMEFSYNTKCAL